MTYLVIPPGGGKTLVGLEAARQLARPTLVLCPNTAIQAQWDAAFAPPPAMAATASRDLPFGRARTAGSAGERVPGQADLVPA